MLKRSSLKRKGQSTAEYAILIAMVVAGTIAMQTYAKRALQARTYDAAGYLVTQTQDLSTNKTRQFEPDYLESDFTVTRNQVSTMVLGNELVGSSASTNIIRAKDGSQIQNY